MLISTDNGFCIQGAVNFDNVMSWRRAGEKWITDHAAMRSFVIDLSEVKDQDSSCFALLLSLMRFAQKNQLTVSLTQVPISMKQMGKMFGLSDFING